MEHFEERLERFMRYIHDNYSIDVVAQELIENGIRYIYNSGIADNMDDRGFAYEIYKLLNGFYFSMSDEEIWDNWMDVIYEDDKLIVKSTGHDYDFIATMEVNPDVDEFFNHLGEKLFVIFTGDYEDLERCEIRTDHGGGILADEEGWRTLEAIEAGAFYTEWESEFNAEQIEY